MSDVYFDTGEATLTAGARESLAKLAGVLLVYPGLTLEVEGHTDSIGDAAYNQWLSERRANAVGTYLASQGVDPTSISMRGFGEARPVADNLDRAGRQLNRRVELVVSGELIGIQMSALR